MFAASWVCLDGRGVFGSAVWNGRAHNDLTITTFLGLAQQQWASAAIAPASGCRKFFDALGSTDKTWLLCAETVGFSKDFSHGELVIGREARAELFPRVGEWLGLRNS